MKKETGNKTTSADFEVFKAECEYWIRYFGLFCNAYWYEHAKTDNSLATTYFPNQRHNQDCTISFTTTWCDEKPTHKKICEVAFHEILEVMFLELGDLAQEGCGNSRERSATHKLIRIFENTIFKESYERRYGNKVTAIDTKHSTRNNRSKNRSGSLRTGNKTDVGKR